LLEEIRTTKGQERKAKLEQLGTELRHEEKHVPFNHELEQLHIELKVCTETGSGLKCEAEASEELVVHDAAVLGGSAQKTMLDQLGNGDRCSYGACAPGSMMTECLANQCQSPSRFQSKNQQSDLCYASQVEGFENGDKYGPPRGGAFSCIKETAQGHDTPIVSGRVGTEGLFFRTGTQSKAHVTGHMQWHVTVPSPGTCVPELGDGLYIGMGVSEADACLPNGPDLDLGVLFYKCASGVGMKVGSSSDCQLLNYRTYGKWKNSHDISTWVQYSGDNQDGSGGGDDEWFFIRLDAARQLGVTHIAVTTHIYGCEKSPKTDVPFSQLEGAFMRFASGPVDKDNFKGVETFAYMDIDVSMAKANSKGAIMAVLFLENPQDHPLPVEKREFVEKGREDALAQVGQRWQIGFLADPIRSSNSYTLHNSYGQVGHQVFGNKEISDAHRLAYADPLTKLSTGHPETVGGQAPVILDALEQQQVNAFEGERHNSDSSDASTAKHMSEEHFYQHMSYTFPSGHPGTSLYCFAKK